MRDAGRRRGIKKFRADFEALIKKKKVHLVPAVA